MDRENDDRTAIKGETGRDTPKFICCLWETLVSSLL
jgi:hypothetical protein